MDFIAADMFSAPSGSPMDRSVVQPRAARSSASSSTRKSFSSALQNVHGEERKHNTRVADDGRITNKADRSSSKETQGLNNSPSKEDKGLSTSSSQIDHSDNTSARVTDELTTKGGEEKDGEHEETGLELSSEQIPAAVSSEEHVPTQPASTNMMQAQAHSAGQTEFDSGEELHPSKSGNEPVEHSVKPTVADSVPVDTSPTASERTGLKAEENHSFGQGHLPSSQGGQQQAGSAPVIQKNPDPPAAHVVNQNPPAVVPTGGIGKTDHVDTRPVSGESQPVSVPLSPEVPTRHAVQLDAETMPSYGTSPGVKVPSTQHENIAPIPLVRDQVPLEGQSLGEQEDLGPRPQVVFSYGHPQSVELNKQFGEWWLDQQGRQQGNPETEVPKIEIVDRQVVNSRTAEPVVIGAQVQSSPTPPIQTSVPTQPSHTVVSASDLPQQPVASMIRSMVVDVAQPNLGHVNIRVAMMNDSVHAHVSTDRAEVGQYLINGQDRLQAALQTNGLDMGQFRVDIDRQSSGRSFQHGPSQGQEQPWNQGSQGGGGTWAQHSDRQDEPRTALHGLLNVVA